MRHINDTYACMDACSEHCIYVHTYIYVLARRLNEELQAKTASLLKEADSFIMVSFGKCELWQVQSKAATYFTPHHTTLQPYWEGGRRHSELLSAANSHWWTIHCVGQGFLECDCSMQFFMYLPSLSLIPPSPLLPLPFPPPLSLLPSFL